MTISRRPPTFMPMMASLNPGITPLSWNVAGPWSVHDASNTFPDHRAPTYWTVTVELGPATAPVPTNRSLPVSLAGGLPVPAAMTGSLFKSAAPLTAGTGPGVNRVLPVLDAAPLVEVGAAVGFRLVPQPARASTLSAPARARVLVRGGMAGQASSGPETGHFASGPGGTILGVGDGRIITSPVVSTEAGAARPATAQGGWHWTEWWCEFFGTALLLLGGLSAVCLDFGSNSPVATVVPSHSTRLLITGLLFGGSGSLVTVSPLGRRSGAHLNPCVTLAFWRRGHVHPHDLAGYTVAQFTGAFAGTALVKWWWGAQARSVDLGVTEPRSGLPALNAAGIEALMTAVLVFAILAMVSSARTAPYTPLVLWIVIAVLVWQGARWTGTSLNPARSLAPAVLTGNFRDLWVYFAGPVVGSVAAVGAFGLVPGLETVTAKLFHDSRYASTLASALPVTNR